VSRYRITAAGRAALKRHLAEDNRQGFGEAASPFADQHRDWDAKEVQVEGTTRTARMRYNAAESPITMLARRKDKDGTAYLEAEHVTAAERLREDFELSHMGPRIGQNWEKFLTGGERGGFHPGDMGGSGSDAARARVAAAMRDLGPGLGDAVLRVCCFLEGIETAEKRLGWAARSGKVVLRIALQRLARHYETYQHSPLIG